ncbi:hypothetical protein [Prescottella defluvii]|nr:hypothetical protein [Prescottella defluvii]
MSAHRPTFAGRSSATWSLSTEEIKRRLEQMYGGDPVTPSADDRLSAA